LAELLVSVGVLVLLVLFASQLLNSAASITTLGHKQMDVDAQARQLLDRMTVDFAQMVKRSDVDYYLKSSAAAPLRRVVQPGNDKIAFYSAVPGYYASGSTSTQQSPISLVSYRVNAQNKLERMGKGLTWNAVSPADIPVVFMPIPLASPLPIGELPSPAPNPTYAPAWPNVDNLNVSPTPDPNTEVAGSQVFRFEYYYLLKGGTLSDKPWYSSTNFSAMQDVAAIVVVIAVIDPKSKVLLSDSTTPPQIAQVASQLVDWGNTVCVGCPTQTQWQTTPGLLRTQWQNALNAITSLPRPAVSGIRVYERYFFLTQRSF
jgi:hypothetical protein